jgi:hypothetical protein
MAVKHVIEHVRIVPLRKANAFLIEGHDGLTLIDAGFPNKEAAVFEAIRGLGNRSDESEAADFHSRPPGRRLGGVSAES